MVHEGDRTDPLVVAHQTNIPQSCWRSAHSLTARLIVLQEMFLARWFAFLLFSFNHCSGPDKSEIEDLCSIPPQIL